MYPQRLATTQQQQQQQAAMASVLGWLPLSLLNLSISDVLIAMAALFISSAVVNRIAAKGGPMMWPVLGLAPQAFLVISTSNIYDWVTDALISAGGTFSYRGVWFGRLYGVVTIDPLNIEYILKTRFSNFPKGPYFRERFSDFLGDGIFNADDSLWKDQRRAATAEMHSSRYSEYSTDTIRDLVHRKLLVLLDRLAGSGAAVDLQDLFLRFTFDNICTAAFGVDPGCLAVDLPEVPFARAFEEATELTLFRFLVPPFVWKPMRRLGVGAERRLKAAIRTVHGFAEKTVSDRRAELRKLGGLSNRYDLMSRLMEADHAEERFTDRFLKDFCISFILAGRDTSSVALAWFFWLLSKHPEVERRILEEISGIVGGRRTEEVGFTAEEMKRMEYMQAALTETLRLYPSVPIDFKEVMEDDEFPDGTRVKRGARVLYSIYSMGRAEGIWGKDCREFRPERWMREGVFVGENQFKYAVFNAGPRLCIGKKFAYAQMKMVAASMLMRYRVEVVEGQSIGPKITTTLYIKNGLKVVVRPRETSHY